MDKIKQVWIKLLYSWSVFISIITDPTVIVSSIILFFLYKTNETANPLFYITVSLFTALLGARATKKWTDIAEEGIIKTRGKTAVRGLKLLLGNITSLEQRVAKFCSNDKHIKENPDVTIRNYEEIRGKCLRLQEEVISSIENWTEFVPEADIKTQIGEISGVASSLLKAEEELKTITEELKNTKTETEDEKAKLESELTSKQLEIKSLRSDLMHKNLNLGVNSYSNDHLKVSSLSIFDYNDDGYFKGIIDPYMRNPLLEPEYFRSTKPSASVVTPVRVKKSKEE